MISLETIPPSVGPATRPSVKIVKPRERQAKKVTELPLWTIPLLKTATDAFHKGVLHLIQNGARQVLLLCPQSKQSNLFAAAGAYQPDEKETLWKGLTFDPAWLGDLQQNLLFHGYVEVAAGAEPEGFLAKTFGMTKHDWLLLVRCGSPQSCTGILALISSSSIRHEVKLAFGAKRAAA